MNRFPEEILDMIIGYLVKSCRRRLRNPFKRSCWKYLGPCPVRVAPFATVCKRFQRLIEPHTFSELYMDEGSVSEDKFKLSFFHSHESKGWRLPVVPTIGSFALSSTNRPAGGRPALPTRLIEAILPQSNFQPDGRFQELNQSWIQQNVMLSPHLAKLEVCDRLHLMPGFDDFMIVLLSAMVTTMPRLETLLISFRLFHGPIAHNGPYYVKYDRPSVLRMWRALNDAHREGIYGPVGRGRQGPGGWIVPKEVLENLGALLQKMRKRVEGEGSAT
ncbi:hypothetical protein B0T18DRAFT_394458 [Schizothecium vesticola]|uniref:F-box domain-containing protein n=1 Tax=Schizothecium vesticola TaxID=314040 RepID=A0AA40EIH1_9PEZI|nr:hypothetical protein B0T18DRAFT_394458 [Schizothecium vesticola]